MKTATFTLERNQIFDIIRNLKKFVKAYDNPDVPGRYIEARILLNKDLCVSIKLDRSKDAAYIRRTSKRN